MVCTVQCCGAHCRGVQWNCTVMQLTKLKCSELQRSSGGAEGWIISLCCLLGGVNHLVVCLLGRVNHLVPISMLANVKDLWHRIHLSDLMEPNVFLSYYRPVFILINHCVHFPKWPIQLVPIVFLMFFHHMSLTNSVPLPDPLCHFFLLDVVDVGCWMLWFYALIQQGGYPQYSLPSIQQGGYPHSHMLIECKMVAVDGIGNSV